MDQQSIVEIILHKRSRTLELVLAQGERLSLPAQLLRVKSPSAEVKGHGKPRLVTGKEQVGIRELLPAGLYGLRICFDDGHDTGLYTWTYLLELAVKQEALWQQYLAECAEMTNQSDDNDIAIKVDNDNDEKPVQWRPSKST